MGPLFYPAEICGGCPGGLFPLAKESNILRILLRVCLAIIEFIYWMAL